MFTILENIEAADDRDTLVCQDTGLPVFKVSDRPDSNRHRRAQSRLRKGCERATADYPLRSNTVHPLTRKHTGTNTGRGIPVIKLEFVPGSDCIEIHMAPKGLRLGKHELSQDAHPGRRRRGREEICPAVHLRFRRAACPPDDRRHRLGRHVRRRDAAGQRSEHVPPHRLGQPRPGRGRNWSASCSTRSTRPASARKASAARPPRWPFTSNGRTRISARIRWP